MRKGWKKAVSTMLCAAMILSMSSFMVSADGEPTIPETPAGDATTEVPGDEKDPEEQPPVKEEKDPADEEKDPADEEKDPADEENQQPRSWGWQKAASPLPPGGHLRLQSSSWA